MRIEDNNFARVLFKAGYSYTDLKNAYPNQSEETIANILKDNAAALSRPLLSYGLLGIHEKSSRHFNIHAAGFRKNGTDQPWPIDPQNKNIFFFGGSTVAGFNVQDSDTIPAFLEKICQKKNDSIRVYNYGSGNYTNRHNFLRLLGLIDRGIIPQYAIFLDGYNDCYYAFGYQKLTNILDALYQREKKIRQSGWIKKILMYWDRKVQSAINTDDALEITTENFQSIMSTNKILDYATDYFGNLISGDATLKILSEQIAKRVTAAYQLSQSLIISLCAEYNIKPFFYWQPVPFFKTETKHRVAEKTLSCFPNGALCYFGYHGIKNRKETFKKNDITTTDLSELGITHDQALYCDICHYSPYFSRIIAERIAVDIVKNKD
jgi:L-rhamnose mutarotase